jgi:hypothetical protein
MALISPGVEVTVTDESNYAPNQLGSIPLIVLATAQDKLNPSSTTATATTAANAGKLVAATSQRELTSLFGTPTFYKTSSGTPIHGYDINEYGLMTAYSLLGVSNRVYMIRADVNTAELVGTTVRPTGSPANGTYWLDLSDTLWGIFEWNSATQAFTNKVPTAITSTSDLTGGVPKTSIGNIGDYVVVTTNTNNPVYYKKYDNSWVLVGSTSWQNSHGTVIATTSNPTLTSSEAIIINGSTVTLTGTTVASLVSDINTASITGITAYDASGLLTIFADSTATSDGSTADGAIVISNSSGTPLADLGITAGTYYRPALAQAAHTSVPTWKTNDSAPRPTGSVWIKTTTANVGASFDVSIYSSTTDAFSAVSAPVYENDQSANKTLDATGGGKNIGAGSVYVQYDVLEDDSATYKLYKRTATGNTTVTGSVANPVLTGGNTFTIQQSVPNSETLSTAQTVTLSGTDAAGLVSDLLALGLSQITASVNSAGKIVIEHTGGGVIVLKNTSGTPLTTAGITTSLSNVRAGNDSDLIVSNWIPLTYTASLTTPNADPVTGTLWYYNAVDDVDIMIHDGTNWKGYQTLAADARGYDLTATDPEGVIVAASEPTTQSDSTALVSGDLWINTSNLENYPALYRYDATDAEWTLIDNTDQTSENGILFADARWDTDGTTNPITGDLPLTTDLLTSNYTDLDVPSAALYPRGTLLFNTRRSGYNVKEFKNDYFNADDFSGSLPTIKDAWVNKAGNKSDGSPYMGRKAVRQVVVAAMKSALDSNTEIREEQNVYNIIAAPGYEELTANMVSLNNDRRNTAFIVADTPFRLAPSATEISNYNNNTGAWLGIGATTTDPYVGLYYPSAQSTDLTGSTIVVPPSHMALRTIVRSDDVSFPWFAPAGTKRGLVDNATQLGYVNAATGEFVLAGLTEGVRDSLYENKINPITFLPGIGLTVYGQKTRDPNAPSSLDRINVARLVVYMRTNLDTLAKPFVFEPNDKLTRDEIKQIVEQLCNDLVAKRALNDYVVVCDETNNTPVRIDRNELYVDVAIEPVKAAEFIFVPIRLKNTGEIAGTSV